MKLHYDGPVVLVVMDGVGLGLRRSGNAVRQAHTEFLDTAMMKYLNIPLAASGEAVGIMPGQMGNSEVGHNAIGSGQIIQQGISQVEVAFATGDIWESKAWRGAIKFLKAGNDATSTSSNKTWAASAVKFWQSQAKISPNALPTLHFCGIFSDGGVHSDIKHLEQMIARAYEEGVRRMRIHAIFDGRDVAPQSEPKYIERLEKFCQKFPDADIRIASGGGRMVMTADRYENDWNMVKLGYDAMVYGKAPRQFSSATEAIKTLRAEQPGIQDQYLPAFVIVDNVVGRSPLASRAIKAKSSSAEVAGRVKPIGRIMNGDAVIYYDFRADRAVEIAEAFTAARFDKFDRTGGSKTVKDPDNNLGPYIYFAGLAEYDADRHIPKHVLVPPVTIDTPLNTFLGQQDINQLAISETVKFGHITYYFNGNSYRKAPGEKHIEIPSDSQPFNTRPWMKSAEITDVALENLDKYKFVRINFPGGDMVGHFAELEPTIVALEAIDIQLARLAKRVDALGGVMVITADHGNAEELLDRGGTAKTAHTTNPVPCIFYDNTKNAKLYHIAKLKDPGLANIAATIATLLGQANNYPASWQKPLIGSR
jgi:2,3-bisphosphoglycerate-independent phosphoglycerate mutase